MLQETNGGGVQLSMNKFMKNLQILKLKIKSVSENCRLFEY